MKEEFARSSGYSQEMKEGGKKAKKKKRIVENKNRRIEGE